METQGTLEVTVHKSHLVTIGERLYGEAVELLRELVNNAYDADAAEVHITITPEEVVVKDNGTGMDLEGLKQYFNIGSPEKRLNRVSARFGRDRIGEFGIGKFASLSAARRFEVWTQKGPFQATVWFDKDTWETSGDAWTLPLKMGSPSPNQPNGTRVSLQGLTKGFDLAEVERRLMEAIPIQAPNFAVYLNGHRLESRPLAGQHIPFLEGTPYGVVHGEIIVVPASQANPIEAGIACKVKQVLVRRDFFGIEAWGAVASRLVGEANADFLPLTSDRNDFIRDTPEYQAFQTVMHEVMLRVRQVLDQWVDIKESRRTKRVLSDVLQWVREALIRNPAYCPEGLIPIAEGPSTHGPPGFIPGPQPKSSLEFEGESPAQARDPASPKAKRTKRPQVKWLTPSAVIKRLKLGQQGLSCCIDRLGPETPECYTEGTVVYINRDHPLHRKFAQDKEAYALYLARLLTQEIALMKQPRSARQAFERQSVLLRDVFSLSRQEKPG